MQNDATIMDFKKHQEDRERRRRQELCDVCLQMVEDIPVDDRFEEFYGLPAEGIALACAVVLCDKNDDNPETTELPEPLENFEDRELATIIEAVCRDFLDGRHPYTVYDSIKRDVVATHDNCWIKANRYIVETVLP